MRYRLGSHLAFQPGAALRHVRGDPARDGLEKPMSNKLNARTLAIASAIVATLAICLMLVRPGNADGTALQPLAEDGIVRVQSVYKLGETIERLKRDLAAKGIMFFQEIDQTKLAADAGIKIRPSTLLTFGNPALGTLFVNARPEAGIDWPVRLLVQQDEAGRVWLAYTDFAWIARRHRITGRDEPFKTASKVIASITASVAAK
jgi:uncharacterized protein (DUF302 family)